LDLFASRFKDEKYFVTIMVDSAWSAYLEFLYPNEETREWMRNVKVADGLQKAGDKLTEARRVDHRAYFATAADREDFLNYYDGWETSVVK
jgi:hypothetical protein